MVNRILFLGTAGDSIVISKQYKASGGIILNLYGNQFHIDPGPNTTSKASEAKINLRENICLLVSSPNLINSNDANIVINAMTYEGFDKTGVLVTNNFILNGDEQSKGLIGKKQKNYVEKIIVLNKEKRIGIENIEIQGLGCSNDKNIGFKFYTPDFVLTYAGNTGFDKKLIEQYKGSNILILNVKNLDEKKLDELNTEDAKNIINEVKPDLTILTGFGISMLKADPTFIARELKIQTNQQVIAAKDNMSIEPDSYAAESKQRSLLGGF